MGMQIGVKAGPGQCIESPLGLTDRLQQLGGRLVVELLELRFDLRVELVTAEEPVVDAVLFAGPLRARRRRHGNREIGEARQDELDQRALAGSRLPGDDEDRQRSSG